MDRVAVLMDRLTDEELEMMYNYLTAKYNRIGYKPTYVLTIPYKFPSLNEYTNACRKNAYAGANMKKKVQNSIGYFINQLPVFENPIKIKFTWYEGNRKRDPDNVIFAKKFILDAMIECGKIKNDGRKQIKSFRESIVTGDEWKVVMEIEEEVDK